MTSNKRYWASGVLLLLVLTGPCLGGDTRLTTPDGRTRAYIDERGRIYAPNGRTLGYVEQNGRISRPDGSTAGYLEDGGKGLEGLDPRHPGNPGRSQRGVR